MSENTTKLPSLRNQEWKTIKAETEKINELFTHISTSNVTELNELIHARVKLVRDKNLCSPRTRTETQNMDGKLDWKHR